jgi:hypothetical protein
LVTSGPSPDERKKERKKERNTLMKGKDRRETASEPSLIKDGRYGREKYQRESR